MLHLNPLLRNTKIPRLRKIQIKIKIPVSPVVLEINPAALEP